MKHRKIFYCLIIDSIFIDNTQTGTQVLISTKGYKTKVRKLLKHGNVATTAHSDLCHLECHSLLIVVLLHDAFAIMSLLFCVVVLFVIPCVA